MMVSARLAALDPKLAAWDLNTNCALAAGARLILGWLQPRALGRPSSAICDL